MYVTPVASALLDMAKWKQKTGPDASSVAACKAKSDEGDRTSKVQRLELPSAVVLKRHERDDLLVLISLSLSLTTVREQDVIQAATLALSDA